MAELDTNTPSPTEIKLHQKSRMLEISFADGNTFRFPSWDVLYDYGLRQEELWRQYLKRMAAAGASREPGPAPFGQRPKSK